MGKENLRSLITHKSDSKLRYQDLETRQLQRRDQVRLLSGYMGRRQAN